MLTPLSETRSFTDMAFVQAGAELMDMVAAAVREHGDMNQFAQ